jgi:predicted RNase H-like HicB family nuclease
MRIEFEEIQMTQHVYYGTVCQGGGTFGIVFLDFPGCISAGDTMEEVITMGHEALQLHLDGMVEDGDDIPLPSLITIERTKVELDNAADPVDDEQWVAVVPILVNVADALETAPIPIETKLLHEVSQFSTDRRQFIIDATQRELARLKQSA